MTKHEEYAKNAQLVDQMRSQKLEAQEKKRRQMV